ncbi:tetratricopeptide repeat-containing sensor histidine kinase [Flavicella sp.]|uniref:ATP-binding protein n=1 Tax=Flavicella sp. TaxID=2957742 RepID=UPI00260E3637|nr:tetratricopeptide repeat-containing sensor histidine kinase [Flavicella sp.]MDG1806239.1 tetratricopeptide repeat-containing sensor histidine kinase [Flavicella sp.]
MVKLYILILWSFCFFQEDILAKNSNPIDLRAQAICEQTDNELFCRSVDFYKQEEFDSLYVYTAKALLTATTQSEKDLLNYYQSFSALKKKLFKKAIECTYNISNDTIFKSLKNNTLGYCFLHIEEYEKAIKYYTIWLENFSFERISKKRKVYHNLGLAHNSLTQNDKAEYYLKQEAELIKDKNDTLTRLNSLQAMANVYYGQYKDDLAIPLFIEAYQLAQHYSDFTWKESTTLNMAVIEKNRENYQASNKYYLEAYNWKDSIHNRDRIWELTEKEKEVAVAQKELEIAVEREKVKRQKTQRNALIIGISFLIIFILVLWFFYKQRTAQNKLITQQKEDLTAANKTKDYLFSVVSHDLRSPINTLGKLHKRLARQIKKEDLEAINGTNNKALILTESTYKLLNNVLSWSLEQNNQMVFVPTEYPLHNLVEHVLYDFKNIALARNIELETALEEVNIEIDIESIKIVIRNLVDNAIKYTPQGGRIKVTCGTTKDHKKFVRIKDNGIGIHPENLEKIRNLKDLSIDKIDRAEGVGLGMILCQTLIKKNQGEIKIESTLDKGSKFTILLP